MATYAIGDIQGCHASLLRLLDGINFDPAADTLWFVGDLVNRGPDSLQVLRTVRDLGDRAVTVLGNHDLHLLALWQGQHRHASGNDTLQPILTADDGDDLCHWLRHRPLLHLDSGLDFLMIHAGLPPQWDITTARALAAEIEQALRGDGFTRFLQQMYGNQPDQWSERLQGMDRLRFAVNCFTRLRFCTPQGRLDFTHKGPPDKRREDVVPWYTLPQRKSCQQRILFGHWSTLGFYHDHNVWALDSGCLWGGRLTAMRLEDLAVFSEPCPATLRPGGAN